MDEQKLIGLFRRRDAEGDRTAFCPGDDVIAGFVDGMLSPDESEHAVRHLADCDACLGRVGRLNRLRRETPVTGQAPENAIARAARLSGSRVRYHRHWAAAAGLLLAVLFVPTWIQERAGDSDADMSVTRRIEAPGASIDIVVPSHGQMLEPGTIDVAWQPVPGRLHYEVRILTNTGDLVVEQRTEEARWSVPAGLDLRPGNEYFVRVDARMQDARTIRSPHVRFEVAERE